MVRSVRAVFPCSMGGFLLEILRRILRRGAIVQRVCVEEYGSEAGLQRLFWSAEAVLAEAVLAEAVWAAAEAVLAEAVWAEAAWVLLVDIL